MFKPRASASSASNSRSVASGSTEGSSSTNPPPSALPTTISAATASSTRDTAADEHSTTGLWLGATSNFCRTYLNAYGGSLSNTTWIFVGVEPEPPTWLDQFLKDQVRYKQKHHLYLSCDFTQVYQKCNSSSSNSNSNSNCSPTENGSTTAAPATPTTAAAARAKYQRLPLTNSAAAAAAAAETPGNSCSELEWLRRECSQINQIVVTIRPPLISPRTNKAAFDYNHELAQGLELVLHTVMDSILFGATVAAASTQQSQQQQQPLQRALTVLHLSSIAAIGHLQPQILHSEENTAPDPMPSQLEFPYDRFKRECELIMERLPTFARTKSSRSNIELSVYFTNLRCGAIFSDSPSCIQCQVLRLQAALNAPSLPRKIDCNSSRNVAAVIHRMLLLTTTAAHRHQDGSAYDLTAGGGVSKDPQWRPVYYYTRPASYSHPVAYGEYLQAYKRAYNIQQPQQPTQKPQQPQQQQQHQVPIPRASQRYQHPPEEEIWTFPYPVPLWMVEAFVAFFHFLTWYLGPFVPFLESIDYLLQVTNNEHTFDQKYILQDFPQLPALEETVEDCFRRRKRFLELEEQQQQQQQRQQQQRQQSPPQQHLNRRQARKHL